MPPKKSSKSKSKQSKAKSKSNDAKDSLPPYLAYHLKHLHSHISSNLSVYDFIRPFLPANSNYKSDREKVNGVLDEEELYSRIVTKPVNIELDSVLGNLETLVSVKPPLPSLITHSSFSSLKSDSNESHLKILDLTPQIFTLFERNMKKMYKSSSMGYDQEEKIGEMFSGRSRYFVVTKSKSKSEDGEIERSEEVENVDVDVDVIVERESEENEDPPGQKTHTTPELLAFLNYELHLEEVGSEKVLTFYIMDIQVSPNSQGVGLGSLLLTNLRSLAKQVNLKVEKTMLTVFKANGRAVKFYEREGFKVDCSDPSSFGEWADYIIMSKRV